MLVEEITKVVLMRLSKLKNSPVNSKKLVGIDKSISHLKSLLKKEPHKAPVIGIWGMGGIGKTTIAKELFDQICYEYDGCCFSEKVSEKLTRHGMESLKNKHFSELLAEDVKIDTPNWLPSDIERRIGRMKVLIVLDDVKGTDQLEKLFGSRDWCFILVFGCQTLITLEPFKPVISYFFLGREKVSKTLENRGPGVVFATGRC